MSTSEDSEEFTLSDFKDDLCIRFAEKSFTVDVALTYVTDKGVHTSRRTLERRMALWGIQRKTPEHQVVDQETHISLITQIGFMYHHFRYLNDEQIALRLQEDHSIPTTTNQVREQRLKQNWRRRIDDFDSLTSRRLESANFISTLLDEGTIRQYGRRQLLTHLSRKYGYRATGKDLRLLLRLLDGPAVDSRTRGMKRKRRMNYETRGPNWLWCVDGHDKLQKYGIEIYGCVDAYSRKIIWWYIGLSNRTGISVCRQYLDVIKAVGRCPNFVRSDHGSETTLMAQCQFDLYWQACFDAEYADDELESISLVDCYRYGKSTKNTRIESMWNLMITSITESWMDYLAWLAHQEMYRDEYPTDRVILLYVLLPIIQKEVFEWVLDHNANPIRPQRERTKHVPRIPDELYKGRDYRSGKIIARQYGFTFDDST
jgi:hypothetical protein